MDIQKLNMIDIPQEASETSMSSNCVRVEHVAVNLDGIDATISRSVLNIHLNKLIDTAAIHRFAPKHHIRS
jgi:hypothetical protein